MNYTVVLAFDAGVVLAISAALVVPLALSLLYPDGSRASFAGPAAVMILSGGTGIRLTRDPPRECRGAIAYIANRENFTVLALLSSAFWRR